MQKKRILIAIAASLLVSSIVAVYAFTPYFETTNTFSINPNMQITSPGIGYNVGTNFENVPSTSWTECSPMSAPMWSCPISINDIFPNDQITYGFVASSPHQTVTPNYNVTAGSFKAFTTSVYYAGMSSSGGYTSGVISGLPSMQAGVSYSIWIVVTIGPVSTPATATFTVSFGC